MQARSQAEHYLQTAISAASSRAGCHEALDALPVPLYVTDADGFVTYWNQACAQFAGREPELGADRWCVTWRLYTTAGEALRHEDCPMAQAIRRGRPVREAVAIAERPDGSRVAFRPYPTPLIDGRGNVAGAVNMLIDVTHEQSAALAEQASRCRRLAGSTYDRTTAQALSAMADGFERTARQLQGANAAQ